MVLKPLSNLNTLAFHMNLQANSVVSETPTRRGMEVAASGDVIPFQFRNGQVAEQVVLREHPVPDIVWISIPRSLGPFRRRHLMNK